jgi:hypothetical protein
MIAFGGDADEWVLGKERWSRGVGKPIQRSTHGALVFFSRGVLDHARIDAGTATAGQVRKAEFTPTMQGYNFLPYNRTKARQVYEFKLLHLEVSKLWSGTTEAGRDSCQPLTRA